MKSVNQHLVQTEGMFFLYGRKATDIMEIWMPYEYPFHTAIADEQIDFAAKLLNVLSIEKVNLKRIRNMAEASMK